MRNKALLIFALAYAPSNGLELLFYYWAGYTTDATWYSGPLNVLIYFGGCWLLYERKVKV